MGWLKSVVLLWTYRSNRSHKSQSVVFVVFVVFVLLPASGRKKRSLTHKNQAPEKKSGIELLSHSQICSTIVAGPLIDRVRDGNVSCKPAMDTGKKGLKMSAIADLGIDRNDKQ